jgi:PAS domain S-box-containing protein
MTKPSPAPVRILLVEDERIPALNLQQRLTKLGYEVPAAVPSGPEALAQIAEKRPDIVLMDIHIEGEFDGIETASRIPPDLMIPVIYLTAYSEEATLQRAASTRPHGYLVKPFSERELHATIQMALQRHDMEVSLRQREAELREGQENFRFLFRNNPLPMWVFDAKTLQFLEVNDAAAATYGYSRDEFLHLGIPDVRLPEDVAKITALMTSGIPDFFTTLIQRHLRKNGEVFTIDGFSHALTFEGISARLAVMVDVTQRIAAEAQLRQAQKMEAIGQLTGGVAHDFNNLLAIIQGNLGLLGERVTGNPAATEMISDALRATGRGAVLTQRLLAYSRQQPLEPKTVAVDQLIASLMTLLRRTLGEDVDIQAIMAPDLWPMRIDPYQLENALVNLSVNARDAIPQGGKLTFEGFNSYLDADYAVQNAEVIPGEYALLAVTDTGTGMPPEVVSHAFEPFFTTKPVGRGTGLSMVFGFVKQSGGHVKIYSEPQRGTTIKLYLPRAMSATDATAAANRAQAPLRHGVGETVLVVEDDADVRKLAVAPLTSLGYRTIDAQDGPEALALLKETPHIDLLLTDVVLPRGMNGSTLARAAQIALPKLKVLYMSGYTRNAILHNGVLDEGVHLLMKPFHKAELAVKIRQILDEPSET